MKRIIFAAAATLLLTFAACDTGGEGGKGGNGGGGNPPPPPAAKDAGFSFVPNQLKGNAWYRPGGSHINGHLDESFGNAALWPELMANLKESGGAFSIFAAEIGHLSTTEGFLPLLRAEGIPISVEMPGMTQCIAGGALGGAELNGRPVNGDNIFATIFGIVNPADRADPDRHGWFYTRDRKDFIPDEILFDERQPNLCPEFDANILANTQGTWEERKSAARKNNGCYTFSLPFDEMLERLRQDYIDFLTVAREKWGGDMPEIGIHWNVNPGWEWRDERAMDALYAIRPTLFDTPNFRPDMVLQYPQYNSVDYCNDLVDALTEAGFKPARVLMDVDWTYCIPYIQEVLLRHKSALAERGIQMGINIVEASIADNEELVYRMGTLTRRTASGTPNQLYENTLVAIARYLIANGIYEQGMQLRIGSWSPRPYEQGAEVNESAPGSMAHTANAIYDLMKEVE